MNEPVIYEIVLRGHVGERLLARLADDFSIDVAPGQPTRLVGEIRDAAHLHGVVTQLTSLAIEILRFAPIEEALPPTTHPSERQP